MPPQSKRLPYLALATLIVAVVFAAFAAVVQAADPLSIMFGRTATGWLAAHRVKRSYFGSQLSFTGTVYEGSC
jgi:hypothetical protein